MKKDRREVDELGLPITRNPGRPINPATFRGTARVKTYKRIRGAWPEAIENMRVGDSKTHSINFDALATDKKSSAKEWLSKEGHTIRKALMRVRKEKPEIRLHEFQITRSTAEGPRFSQIVSITLTRLS